MFSFVRSGAIVTDTDLSAGFCACAALQFMSRMASEAKAIAVFFMAAVLLEVRAFRAFIYPDTATTRPVRISCLWTTEQIRSAVGLPPLVIAGLDPPPPPN